MVDPVARDELSRELAVEMLTGYREMHRAKDQMVRMAFAAGLTKHAIHIHSGIARSTIDRALKRGTDD